MNHGRKRDYTIQKIKAIKFTRVEDIRDHFSTMLPGLSQLGYIDPGHGLRGKTQWLTDDEDLASMYCKYAGKHEILLWCVKQMNDQPSSSQPSSKKQKVLVTSKNGAKEKKAKEASHYAMVVSEVEGILDQLREKHGSHLYSVEQLNCWAHMYHTKKHSSLDNPPNLPYFKAAKDKKSTTVAAQSTEKSTIVSANNTHSSQNLPSGISPSKRVNLRTECMKQLEIWYSLLEKGMITKEQYDEVQGTILNDMK